MATTTKHPASEQHFQASAHYAAAAHHHLSGITNPPQRQPARLRRGRKHIQAERASDVDDPPPGGDERSRDRHRARQELRGGRHARVRRRARGSDHRIRQPDHQARRHGGESHAQGHVRRLAGRLHSQGDGTPHRVPTPRTSSRSPWPRSSHKRRSGVSPSSMQLYSRECGTGPPAHSRVTSGSVIRLSGPVCDLVDLRPGW